MDGSAAQPSPRPHTAAPSSPDDLSVGDALRADFRASSWRHRLTLAVVAFWVVYEWGVGNETVTPWILVRVIAASPGWAAVPASAGAGFAFTVTQQLVAGMLALLGFSMFDRTARAAWSRLRTRFGSAPGEWSTLGWGARMLLVFTLGTTAVALVQVMATGRVGVRRHAAVITQSAVLCGVAVGAIGGSVAVLAEVGRRDERLAGGTEWLLRTLGNPIVWLVILVIVVAVHLVRARHGRDADATPTAG